MSQTASLVVLDRRSELLALGAFLVEEFLHVRARQQICFRYAQDVERLLFGYESAAYSQPLLRHLLALLVGVLLRSLVVLLLPEVQNLFVS